MISPRVAAALSVPILRIASTAPAAAPTAKTGAATTPPRSPASAPSSGSSPDARAARGHDAHQRAEQGGREPDHAPNTAPRHPDPHRGGRFLSPPLHGMHSSGPAPDERVDRRFRA